uniref:Uncharacterized protein n=1 Tax=Parastrongyloides trichosuri TaxID=131310 RepID=A0A0N4ZR40_PARTI
MLYLFLLTLLNLVLLSNQKSIAIYPAKIGDTIEFDFGGLVKEITVKRDGNDKIEKLYPSLNLQDSLNKSKKSQLFTNAYLTTDGQLIIDPVTKEDYGTYTSDVSFHPDFSFPTLQIIPVKNEDTKISDTNRIDGFFI